MLQKPGVETKNMVILSESCSNMEQKNGVVTRGRCEQKEVFILRWEMLYLVSMVIKIIQ